MSIYSVGAAGIVLVVLSATVSAQSASLQGAATHFCSRTAQVARTACGSEVRDGYWGSVGRCLNTADASARTACLAEAQEAQKDDREDCGEQFEARVELCDAVGEGPYDPTEFVQENFVDPLEIGRSIQPNPFFPLVPGSSWVYRSATEAVTVEVVGRVRRVAGVPCTVVRDVVQEDGVTTEDTIDWYAQQVDGTVWYCGELSKQFEDGRIASLEGSWEAGRDLARPGVIMKASPHVGDVYRQEFALGDAEDAARIASLSGSADVPGASCNRTCLVTLDFTPLEPGVVERKYYAPNIGLILELDPNTGERLELISYRIP
jgi:hypothetical protein